MTDGVDMPELRPPGALDEDHERTVDGVGRPAERDDRAGDSDGVGRGDETASGDDGVEHPLRHLSAGQGVVGEDSDRPRLAWKSPKLRAAEPLDEVRLRLANAEARSQMLSEALRWVGQTVHQAHHAHLPGTWNDCPKSTCLAVRAGLSLDLDYQLR